MQNVLPKIAEKADEVKTVLDELAALRETQEAQQKVLKEENEALLKQQDTLKSAVAERKALFKKTARAHNAAEQKARTLAQKARDLRDLLSGLRARPSVGTRILSRFGFLVVFQRKLGDAGRRSRLKSGYGDTLPGGGTGQGLQVRRPKGLW